MSTETSGPSISVIARGDIRWANLNPTVGREQQGTRPVLILSHDVFNERSGTVIAIALTSKQQSAGFPLALEIVGLGLPKRSWAKIGQVRTLSTKRIGSLLAKAPDDVLSRVIEGLNDLIGT